MKNILLFFVLAFQIFVYAQTEDKPGKISGYMFGDYFYNVQRDTAISSIPNKALTGDKDLNGFVFRRIYFSYDYLISDSFSSRFRIEVDNSTTSSNGKLTPFVKDAFLKWKNIFYNHDLIIGIQPTPAFEISESIWGFRSLEKTILDLRGLVSSRDLAISLRGKFDTKGKYGYLAMVGNNSGVNLETDKYKRYYLHFNFNPADNIYATIHGDLKSLKSISDPLDPSNSVSKNVFTTALFVGYNKKENISFGAELIYQIRQNAKYILNDFSDGTSFGLSLFGSAFLNEKTSVIARYDLFDPDNDLSSNSDIVNYLIFGFSYSPVEKVMFVPNVQIESFENAKYKTSVTGRVTFYWSFL